MLTKTTKTTAWEKFFGIYGHACYCQRVFSPFPTGKNDYSKDDYIVDCPDLIEPLSPIVIFPNGKWVTGDFGIAVGILLKRTNQNQIEQQHFKGKSHWKGISSSREVINVIYSVN